MLYGSCIRCVGRWRVRQSCHAWTRPCLDLRCEVCIDLVRSGACSWLIVAVATLSAPQASHSYRDHSGEGEAGSGGLAEQHLFDSMFLVFPGHCASEKVPQRGCLACSCSSPVPPPAGFSGFQLFVTGSSLSRWWGVWFLVPRLGLIPRHAPFPWVLGCGLLHSPAPHLQQFWIQSLNLKPRSRFWYRGSGSLLLPAAVSVHGAPWPADHGLFHAGEGEEGRGGVSCSRSPSCCFLSWVFTQGLLPLSNLFHERLVGLVEKEATRSGRLPEFHQPEGFTLGFHQLIALLAELLLLVVFCCVCLKWPNICNSSLPTSTVSLNVGPVVRSATSALWQGQAKL